jgi:Ca2+-binding EF-hand superfamily protein
MANLLKKVGGLVVIGSASLLPLVAAQTGNTVPVQAQTGNTGGSNNPSYGGTGGKVLITDEMREEYTSDFVAFDSDRNNLLDAQEVTANFQGQVKPREMYDFFRTADKNSDGKVSLMEYVDYAADLTAENKAEM